MENAIDVRELSGVLKRLLIEVKRADVASIKRLGNDLIKTSAVAQNKSLIRLAMVCYALAKIYHKDYYRKNQMKWSEFELDLKSNIRKAEEACREGDRERLSKWIDKMFDDIKKLDSSFGRFVSQVTDKAMVRKGSTLYAMGLSLGRAAELTGATKWELLRASGKTRMSDEEKVTKSLKERLEVARRVLS